MNLTDLLFNTMVLYGPTGTRKTTQIGKFARYIYAKTGKQTRLITADGGGYGPIQNYINSGIVDVWRVTNEVNPKLAIIKASKGAWPDKLIRGIRQGKITDPTVANRAEFLKDVGAFAVEGWPSIAAAIIRDSVAKGNKISEEVVGKFTETDAELGTESFGAPGKSHYGFVQNFILDMIRNFSGLPVEKILYTSLEGKGVDKQTNQTVYGPQVAGGALTATIPTYIGDCLHFEDYMEDKGVDPTNPKQKLIDMGVRVWFTNHPDVSNPNMFWPAKARVVGDAFTKFREKVGKSGYFVLGDNSNLETYLTIQDEFMQSGTEEARVWKAAIDAARAKRATT